jgi:alkylation response protein AidB-like acyl-CoA dehydrogenase
MEFDFSEDQRLLQETVRDFLAGECTADFIRGLWETETGRSPGLWSSLAEIGIPGLMVPEAHGGLGMDERDAVLVLEETGRFALAEPVIGTAAVAVPMLVGLAAAGQQALAATWLERIAGGEAIVAVGHSQSPFVSDAHVADLLLLHSDDEIHALAPEDAGLTAERSNDQSRRLFSVDWTPSPRTCVARGNAARALLEAGFDRGALACAAQQLGVGAQLIDMGALYATQRKQFGVAIGSFQAVKHRLANAKVKLEYARSVVYRAAHSVAVGDATRAVDVSMAKVAAGEAARFAAKESLQVHGAIGYTYEQDLHVWMKRAWSLDLAYGTGAWHRARVARAVLDDAQPAASFGFTPAGMR